jgi:dihydrofolate reductase
MSKVFTALAVSADGYITGSNPRPGHGLGDGGMLFDWYGDPRNAAVYEQLIDRVGAVVTGRTTYDDSEGFGGDGPHPAAPMVVVSRRPPGTPAPGASSSPTRSRARSRRPRPWRATRTWRSRAASP